ncbi:MAG: NADH-quinone oxidoreductase subunit NuoE [Dehalococcoidia bacterium]|nr:MAG: NADH-quinone oxidoreductase subunit NuoE [Dehalococcoidia bacterium]
MDSILSDFSRDRGNLIPILQHVQEKFGYLPEEAIRAIAGFLHLSSSTVYSISTFYTQFKLVPSGNKVIKICRGTACHVGGGASLLRDVERRLCIKPGETTYDLEYSLETVACVGACALAPVMIINDEVYGRMNTTDAGKILGNYHTTKEKTKEP